MQLVYDAQPMLRGVLRRDRGGIAAKTRRFSKKLSCRFGIPPETVGSSHSPIPKTRCAGENRHKLIPSSATGSHARAFSLRIGKPDGQSKYRFRGKGRGMAAPTPKSFARFSWKALDGLRRSETSMGASPTLNSFFQGKT